MKEIFLDLPGPSLNTRQEPTESKEQSRKTMRNLYSALQAFTKYTLEPVKDENWGSRMERDLTEMHKTRTERQREALSDSS